jgi:K+-sensing histidine kinase KdpD
MNWGSWILSGFIATLALSTLLVGSQGFRLTRMNVPYLLGTIITPERERARLYGFFAHLINGWVFSFFYIYIFEALRMVNWWFGLLIGLAHALFLLTVVMSLLPSIHPRMASERKGPTARRQLEPPGFMALNYGYQTPISVFLAHAVFGAILGSLYHLH